ncbi:hypothetical protein QJS10_CPA10g01832 [Acorus calamus]|uniref:Pentatricopeptide repeat-containing protein n=1 Tax=Acorus calamus TaxID=4465 RepID=A0AAV9E174_ACOCL|nr:hypothetical protein QJS10_CPA10g01832 [Acorus calamus]
MSSTLLKVLHGDINKPKMTETWCPKLSDPWNPHNLHEDQRITPSMLLRILDLSPPSNQNHLIHFLLLSYKETYSYSVSDATLSFIIDHFLRRHDYSAIRRLLFSNKFKTSYDHHNPSAFVLDAHKRTASVVVPGLIRAGRPKDAIAAFNAVNFYVKHEEFAADVAVELWRKGQTGHAGSMVSKFCDRDDLIRMIVETLGPVAAVPMFNGKLHSILRISDIWCDVREIRVRDYTRINPRRIEKVLIEMDAHGVPLNAKTFNILIYYLAKIRRADDARLLFQSMEQRGFTPNSRTYALMARAFYKARRIDEGDELVMKARNMPPPLRSKYYRGFVKILCKAGMFEHAVRVFEMMSRDGFFLKAKTYNMLLENLSLRNKGDALNAVFAIAKKERLPMKDMSVYLSDGTVLQGLSEDARAKYWELCGTCGKILHLGVGVYGSCGSVMSAYINAVTRVYSDVQSAEGDDATRPSLSVVESWLRGLGGLERAGMDVSFLRERIEHLKMLSVPSGDVEHPEA